VMQRCENLAFFCVALVGLVALCGVTWEVPAHQAAAPASAPLRPTARAEMPGLAELALAAEANANNIGVRLASEGEFGQAVQCFRYALRRDHDYLPGHKNLLAALVESGRWPEALAAAREAEAVHPLGHYLTALTAEGAENAENDHDATRSGGNAEQQTANGELQTASTAGIADSATDRPGDAAKPVLKAQASGLKPDAGIRVPDDPEVRAALYEERDFIANCARAYLENGLLEEAEARYLLHVQLCPNEVKGYNGLAELALRRGNPDDAVRLFAISLRTHGDQPDVVAWAQAFL
jgi:tetratricopeptide (TPR) repeat protein